MAHLLKYDSVLGPLGKEVKVTDGGFSVEGDEIKLLSERDPGALPWGDLGVDVVIESTGFFTKKADAAKHIEGGAKKVIISAPRRIGLTIVMVSTTRTTTRAPTTSSRTRRARRTASSRSPRCSRTTGGSRRAS